MVDRTRLKQLFHTSQNRPSCCAFYWVTTFSSANRVSGWPRGRNIGGVTGELRRLGLSTPANTNSHVRFVWASSHQSLDWQRIWRGGGALTPKRKRKMPSQDLMTLSSADYMLIRSGQEQLCVASALFKCWSGLLVGLSGRLGVTLGVWASGRLGVWADQADQAGILLIILGFVLEPASSRNALQKSEFCPTSFQQPLKAFKVLL